MTHTVSQHATLDDWIARELISFSLASTESIDAAVDMVISALGEKIELLGFGEALHGGEEILILRNRLFQRLVEAHGYSAIAVESSFPRGRLVDEYVAGVTDPGGGTATSYDAIEDAGFSHGFGQLESNRELVEWMRGYNADPSHRVKLRFYGFDSPSEMMYADSPRQLLHYVLDYLTSFDIESEAAGEGGISRDEREVQRDRIDSLLGEDATWEDPAVAFDPSKGIGLSAEATALRIEAEELATELGRRRPELVARGDAARYDDAVRYAAAARQLLSYHAGMARESSRRLEELLGIRDLMMAEHLAYIVSRERGRGKVLAFAHNSHLRCGKAEWQLGPQLLHWWPAGMHVREILGSRYAVIGSAVGTSDANGIGLPERGTLEALLTAAAGSALFVPTQQGQQGQGLPVAEMATLETRSGSVKNATYFPLTPQSLTDFNWLAFFPSIKYQRGGPPLPEPPARATQ